MSKEEQMENCYACDLPATSREHVPPKCLFPELKDIKGIDLRKNLITVPSCEKHNLGKSRDDEFLMVCLAGLVGNNSIGYQHNAGKVSRAVKRSAGRLLEKVLIGKKQVLRIETKNNEFQEVLVGTPDAGRLTEAFKNIIKALYFNETGIKFSGDIRIHLGFLHHPKGNAKTFNEFLKARLAMDVDSSPTVGDNPSVFYYQKSEIDQHGLFSYRLRFYDTVEVMAGMLPSSAKMPSNFVQLLIDGGIKTTVSLGSDTFTFN